MSVNRLAPEWAWQDAIIVVWPHPNSDWKNILKAAEETYFKLSNYICQQQHLIIIAYDKAHSSHIKEILNEKKVPIKNIIIVEIPTNDTWVRDFGPICTASNSNFTAYDFNFDAWGQKYNYDLDNSFNLKFAKTINLSSKFIQIDHMIEAGNIEINSKGELFSSKSCFKRDIHAKPTIFTDLENQFSNWFGVSETYWVDVNPIIGDDTDGHIDNLVRYCSDNIIVYASIGHHNDANNNSLNELQRQINYLKKNHCKNVDTIPLPLPDPIIKSGMQLPASYTNFLITNHCIFVPVFNDKQDANVLQTFDELFPTREVIDIDSTILIQQFGGIHCATMQIPKGLLA